MNLGQTLSFAANQKEFKYIAGLKIAIEVRAGEVRKGKDKQGRAWAVKLPFAYGRIQGTKGMDGENVDCIVGPDKHPKKVWVVALPKDNGNEDKVMLGFNSTKEAIKAFLGCYQFKRKFLGKVSAMSIDKLKKRLAKRRGRRLSASGAETSPWSYYDYMGFDPVSPRDEKISRSDEGYNSRDEFEEFEEKLRKSPGNVKWFTELARRLGAKTIAESALIENWPHGYIDGRP